MNRVVRKSGRGEQDSSSRGGGSEEQAGGFLHFAKLVRVRLHRAAGRPSREAHQGDHAHPTAN